MWIPADRLLHVVDRHPNPATALKGKSCERLLRDLRAGYRAFVSLRAADSLLANLDLVHWWHVPADQGGLADIYEDGVQYGSPQQMRVAPPPAPLKYATDEERRAARRQTYRRYYQRRVARTA